MESMVCLVTFKVHVGDIHRKHMLERTLVIVVNGWQCFCFVSMSFTL